MFAYLYYGDIKNWNTSEVTNMSSLFENKQLFNKNISAWDTSSVTNMSGMFYNARMFDQDISGWNVSNVTDMSNMFHNAYVFNQDISGWNISNTTNISGMFHNAHRFKQRNAVVKKDLCVNTTKYEYNIKCSICYTKNKITEHTPLIKGLILECCICMVNDANVVFTECNHINTCFECVKKL